MNDAEYSKLRATLAIETTVYESNRKALGVANIEGTDKSSIFRTLNFSRAIILNTMIAMRVEQARRQPWHDVIDRVTRENSVFRGYADLINSTGDHYSPSMDMREPQMKFLADAFDKSSEKLGKSCRAYRYGETA